MIQTKQNRFKSILALLLALVMCMSIVGVTAFAASSQAEPTTPIQKIDVPIADGVYYADIELLQASNPKQVSMGNAALRGSTNFRQKQPNDTYSKSIVIVKDNQATAIVEFMPMGYLGMYGFMMELESVDVKHLQQWGGVYDKDAVFTPATVLARQMTADGATVYDPFNNPSSDMVFNGNKTRPAGFGYDSERSVDISDQPYSHILALDVTPINIQFAEDDSDIPVEASQYTEDNAAYVHVFVPVMFSISASSGDQYARMKVDWTTVQKIENPENNLKYALWSAKQIEQGNYTDASYNVLQNTIAEITTRLENIWPEQTITMKGSGFAAQPQLEQKEYSDSENDEMTSKLNTAVSALEFRGDKNALIASVAKAKEISDDLYTVESYEALKKALDFAETVKNNEDASVSEVNKAVEMINSARASLIYLDADYSALNALIEKIPSEISSICTKESAQAVQEALGSINWGLNITEQAVVNEYAEKLQEAINNLVYLGADYTAVSAALARIPNDLSLYTDETAQAVIDAEGAVDWTKRKTEQSLVDNYAEAIKAAVDALVFKPADYTAVHEALAKVPDDLSVYTEETVLALQSTVNAVVYGKDMSERDVVEAYAKAIEQAIGDLKYQNADYTAVDEALDKIPDDLSVYTDETVSALENAVYTVERDKIITEQSTVDSYAKAITESVLALQYKQADYSAVDKAIANIPADLSVYTEASAQLVIDAKNAVIRGKNITEQELVSAMAEAINKALKGLEKRSVALDKHSLKNGVYSIYAEMVKVNRQDKSMSNDAINHTVKLTVENGEYYLTLDFHGLHYLNRFGYLAKLAYYDNGYTYGQYGKIEGTLIPAEILSTQKNSDGSDVVDAFNQAGGSSEGLLYPDRLRFPLVSDALNDADGYIPLHVFVPVMEDISEGTGDQDVLLQLDWSTLQATTEADPGFEPDKPVEQSPAVDLTDSATGVKIHADKGVFEEGVKLIVTEIQNGSAYTHAAAALSEVGRKFKLYEIHFEDSDGNEVQPNGFVTVSYLIPAGYDANHIALYRINEDESKTLVKGEVKDGYYAAVQKSFSTYAIVEKDSAITDTQNTTNVENGSNPTAPRTGDNSNSTVWLMFVSAGVLAVLTFTRKRRVTEGE